MEAPDSGACGARGREFGAARACRDRGQACRGPAGAAFRRERGAPCLLIRRHYLLGTDKPSRRLGIFLIVGRAKGLILMLKDSKLKLPEGEALEATLKIADEPFGAFSAQVEGSDEIGIFPQHDAVLAAAIEKGSVVAVKAKVVEDNYEFSVHPGVIGWLRACARRNEMAIEPAGQ
ncbi:MULTISPECIES: hypothetical protein [unclassified Bradyrhizobium]|uniref:hypothetical protein n=1 Tax=unclassified Bradyrhizobium TaxID=2631580 RepID=UPI00247AE8F3|nr:MULTISPECIES: hypothetical protein [unclassified Bradyrhizobium]WGR68195.1 hypothetical protein MTX24_22380 [Bradyrhizobium sp. ISRA426]WGR80250.1 hypothetical protein MTX21_07495 [Bradyrhizobium sp. ISRA430]WGR83435.1 hypothetical protein MTX25_22060 [Bradyrhizobium sp. ISRA432]